VVGLSNLSWEVLAVAEDEAACEHRRAAAPRSKCRADAPVRCGGCDAAGLACGQEVVHG